MSRGENRIFRGGFSAALSSVTALSFCVISYLPRGISSNSIFLRPVFTPHIDDLNQPQDVVLASSRGALTPRNRSVGRGIRRGFCAPRGSSAAEGLGCSMGTSCHPIDTRAVRSVASTNTDLPSGRHSDLPTTEKISDELAGKWESGKVGNTHQGASRKDKLVAQSPQLLLKDVQSSSHHNITISLVTRVQG